MKSLSGSKRRRENNSVEELGQYHVVLSERFLILTLITASAFSFFVGAACRHLMTKNHNLENETLVQLPRVVSVSNPLPQPLLPPGKHLPHFVYSSRTYGDGAAQSSDSMMISHGLHKLDGSLREPGVTSIAIEQEEDDEDAEHFPSGQHLLVDIENVDGAFLNSETRLAEAMLELVGGSGLTLLSYHCHQLQPVGVSCIGVLLESHVSFHTWPMSGVITLDLFTCGPTPLVPLIPFIEELFAVPRRPSVTGESVKPPHVEWAHKPRGFKLNEKRFRPDGPDLTQYLLGWMEFAMKRVLISQQTQYQKVEIYEVLNPRFRKLESYTRSLVEGGITYEAQHPELFRPDRVVYLDHVVQSRLYGEAAFHEALVHPALFTHDNPRRVAIVGGGEGATLREVLKHRTVEKVTMIEIDKDLVDIAKEYLPEWSDCSSIGGGSCFDDPRAEVIYDDAVSWFINRYSKEGSKLCKEEYDVIIIDALVPRSTVPFSDAIFSDQKFLGAIFGALSSDGILVVQSGESDDISELPSEFYVDEDEGYRFHHYLQEVGFESTTSYEEAQGGLLVVWNFEVAFKNKVTKANWYLNQAEIDRRVQKRGEQSSDDETSLFRHFDGATMMNYQYPSRVLEELSCRESNSPVLCNRGHGFDPLISNAPISAFDISETPRGPQGQLSLLFNVDLSGESYIAVEENVHSIIVSHTTTALIQSLKTNPLADYLFRFGTPVKICGSQGYVAALGALSFVRQCCPSRRNTLPKTVANELNTSTGEVSKSYAQTAEPFLFNAFIDRNRIMELSGSSVTVKSAEKGSELCDEYMSPVSEGQFESRTVRALCVSPDQTNTVTSDETATTK